MRVDVGSSRCGGERAGDFCGHGGFEGVFNWLLKGCVRWVCCGKD